MTDIAHLSVKVTADGIKRTDAELDKLGKTADQAEKKTKKLSTASKALGRALTGLQGIVGTATIGLAINKVVTATAEQERVTAQLNATLQSTQFAAGKTAEELQKTAANLQKLTTTGDEAIIGMQSLLLTFKQIKGDNFDRTTQAVLDMSTAMGQDLKSSALQLGKALNDPIGQLGALTRVGITFTDSQKELIKGMAEAGDMAGAQVEILKELESQFGGSAAAARDTLGGALQGLSNAFGDLFEAQDSALPPLKNSLNEIEDIVSSPEFVGAFQAITKAIIEMSAASLKFITIWNSDNFWVKATSDLLKFAGAFGPISIIMDNLGRDFQKAEGPAHSLFDLITDTEKTVIQTGGALADYGSELQEVEVKSKRLTTSTKVQLAVFEKTQKAYKDSQRAHAQLTDQLTESHEELDSLVESGERHADQLELQVSLIGKTAKEQALLRAEYEHSGRVTDETYARIVKATEALADAEDQTKKVAQAQGPLQDALGQTIARIDTAFASAWQGAFDSFDDFATGIKDAFRSLLGELAHMAITKPIILSIGSALGIGTSSAASAGGLGLPGIGGTALDFFKANSSVYQGGTFSAANAGMGLAGGIGGAFLGNQVYGDTSGIGNALGGIAGTMIPGLSPLLGSALGSFGGGAIEKGINKLFGGNNNGDNRGISNINLGTGASDTFGVGKSYNQANVDALGQLTQLITGYADLIGGSDARISLSAGNNSGLKFQNTKYDTAGDMVTAVFDEIIKSSKKLNPYLKDLVLGFDGTTDEVIAFTETVISAFDSLQSMTEQNPAQRAVADLKLMNESLYQGYQRQLESIDALVRTFDGSAESLVQLNGEMATFQQSAYNMAAAIKGISDDLQGSLLGSASDIRKSVMSDSDLADQLRKEGAFLEAILKNTTDPQQILAISKELEARVLALFEMESERTAADAELAASKLEEINAIAQQRLDQSLGSVVDSSKAINENTSKMLNNFSADVNTAGAIMLDAAQIFLDASRATRANNATVAGEVAV